MICKKSTNVNVQIMVVREVPKQPKLVFALLSDNFKSLGNVFLLNYSVLTFFP